MRHHTPSGNEVSTSSEPYTLRVEMRVVDPTLPRYGTDLIATAKRVITLGQLVGFKNSVHARM